jgi:lysophospholipase L1-like esterase
MHSGGQLVVVLALSLGVVMGVRGDPSRWDGDIAAFEVLDPSPVKPQVLLYGSSSFRLWTNVAQAFPGISVLNRGFGGSQLSDLNFYFERAVVPHRPRILLVYGGDNDLAEGKTPAEVLADFHDLVGRARRILPQTRVAFLAVKPSPKRENLLALQKDANERVRSYAQGRRRVDFLDTATPLLTGEGRPDPRLFRPDQLHLNEAGYERWRRVLEPYIRRWSAK